MLHNASKRRRTARRPWWTGGSCSAQVRAWASVGRDTLQAGLLPCAGNRGIDVSRRAACGVRSHACALVPGAVVTKVNELSSSARLTALPRDQTEGSGASEAVLRRVAHLALGHIWWATLQYFYVSVHGAVALSTAKSAAAAAAKRREKRAAPKRCVRQLVLLREYPAGRGLRSKRSVIIATTAILQPATASCCANRQTCLLLQKLRIGVSRQRAGAW